MKILYLKRKFLACIRVLPETMNRSGGLFQVSPAPLVRTRVFVSLGPAHRQAKLKCLLPHLTQRQPIHMASMTRHYGTPICKHHLRTIPSVAKKPNRLSPLQIEHQTKRSSISSWAIALTVRNVDRRCLVITATLYTHECSSSILFSILFNIVSYIVPL